MRLISKVFILAMMYVYARKSGRRTFDMRCRAHFNVYRTLQVKRCENACLIIMLLLQLYLFIYGSGAIGAIEAV